MENKFLIKAIGLPRLLSAGSRTLLSQPKPPRLPPSQQSSNDSEATVNNAEILKDLSTVDLDDHEFSIPFKEE